MSTCIFNSDIHYSRWLTWPNTAHVEQEKTRNLICSTPDRLNLQPQITFRDRYWFVNQFQFQSDELTWNLLLEMIQFGLNKTVSETNGLPNLPFTCRVVRSIDLLTPHRFDWSSPELRSLLWFSQLTRGVDCPFRMLIKIPINFYLGTRWMNGWRVGRRE